MSEQDLAYDLRDVEPRTILLDPQNPRLTPEERGSTQDELRTVLLTRFKLEELRDSIVASGWVNLDPIICFEDRKQLVVREGNRRVAAVQLLLDPDLAPPKKRDDWAAAAAKLPDDTRRALEKIWVRVYDDPDAPELEAYIGFRHVSGVLEWPAQEKARFIVEMVDRHGWSFTDIAKRVGSYPKHVERNYIASRIIEQARENGIEGADHIQIGVLLRALQAGGISEFLGVEYSGDPSKAKYPIPDDKLDDLSFFVTSTFGSDKQEPILPESRQLTKWAKILQSEEAIRYLKTARQPSFDRAWIKSGGQQSTLADVLNAAADNLEDAIPLLPDFRDDDEIVEALERCARRLSQALRDFPQLRDSICDDQSS